MKDIQRMDKIMETTVKDTHLFINTDLGHHFPEIQLLSSLEWNRMYNQIWEVRSQTQLYQLRCLLNIK